MGHMTDALHEVETDFDNLYRQSSRASMPAALQSQQ